MPELPDLTVVAEGLHAALAGRALVAAATPDPLTLRATPAELAGVVGQQLGQVRRRGKFLILELGGHAIAVNPMLTGRFQLASTGDRLPAKTAVVLRFGAREHGSPAVAEWTSGAAWIPPDGGTAELRYRDPSRMGKVYLQLHPVPRPIPGLGAPDQGPDADDPALTLDVWRDRIRRHPGELKALLRNQSFVAGIGNAYSDEILHAARLAPFRRRATLAEEEVDGLYLAMRETLSGACAVLRARVPPKFDRQVRDFLAVHLRGGHPCPRCSARITEIASRGERTSFCRGCQR